MFSTGSLDNSTNLLSQPMNWPALLCCVLERRILTLMNQTLSDPFAMPSAPPLPLLMTSCSVLERPWLQNCSKSARRQRRNPRRYRKHADSLTATEQMQTSPHEDCAEDSGPLEAAHDVRVDTEPSVLSAACPPQPVAAAQPQLEATPLPRVLEPPCARDRSQSAEPAVLLPSSQAEQPAHRGGLHTPVAAQAAPGPGRSKPAAASEPSPLAFELSRTSCSLEHRRVDLDGSQGFGLQPLPPRCSGIGDQRSQSGRSIQAFGGPFAGVQQVRTKPRHTAHLRSNSLGTCSFLSGHDRREDMNSTRSCPAVASASQSDSLSQPHDRDRASWPVHAESLTKLTWQGSRVRLHNGVVRRHIDRPDSKVWSLCTPRLICVAFLRDPRIEAYSVPCVSWIQHVAVFQPFQCCMTACIDVNITAAVQTRAGPRQPLEQPQVVLSCLQRGS